jgi:hypothetical protein
VNPQAGTELVQKKKIHLADIEPRFLWYSWKYLAINLEEQVL